MFSRIKALALRGVVRGEREIFGGMGAKKEAGGLREALIKARTLHPLYSGSEYFLYMRTARGKVGSKDRAAAAPKGGWRMTGSASGVDRWFSGKIFLFFFN